MNDGGKFTPFVDCFFLNLNEWMMVESSQTENSSRNQVLSLIKKKKTFKGCVHFLWSMCLHFPVCVWASAVCTFSLQTLSNNPVASVQISWGSFVRFRDATCFNSCQTIVRLKEALVRDLLARGRERYVSLSSGCQEKLSLNFDERRNWF